MAEPTPSADHTPRKKYGRPGYYGPKKAMRTSADSWHPSGNPILGMGRGQMPGPRSAVIAGR